MKSKTSSVASFQSREHVNAAPLLQAGFSNHESHGTESMMGR